MFEQLKEYCKNSVSFSDKELDLVDAYFEEVQLKKKELFLKDNTVCDSIAFIASGSIRHFYVKNGDEKTCDMSFSNGWVTDFQSFTHSIPCIMNLQAMESTTLFVIQKENLFKLYRECNKYETFGRLMAENVAQRATEIAMSLSSDKPEERFTKLLKKQPDILQLVSQKYVANFLGISAESLSRIRKRIIEKQKS